MSRNGRPTQAELQRQAKEDFLLTNERRFKELLTVYFLSQGHLPRGDGIIKAALNDPSNLAATVQPIIKVFRHSLRLVSDGGSLTAKRKEQMLEGIYQMEELVADIGEKHPALQFYTGLESSSTTTALLVALVAVSGSIGFFWSSAWLVCAISTMGAIVSWARTIKLQTFLDESLATATDPLRVPTDDDIRDPPAAKQGWVMKSRAIFHAFGFGLVIVDKSELSPPIKPTRTKSESEASSASVTVNARLKIEYKKFTGEQSIRVVDVSEFDPINRWVIGFCSLREDQRTFALDRIDSAVDVETGEVVDDLESFLLTRRRKPQASSKKYVLGGRSRPG